MGYFRELPDLEYQSFLSDRIRSNEYLRVKNLFRRVKLRDDLYNVFTAFEKYAIVDGARPETVAEEFYGRADLDWVVLITAGIINVRNDWPLSDRDLYKFVEEKYGIEGLSAIRFYETVEVKDKRDRLILPAGQVVDKDFSIPNLDDPLGLSVINPVVGISNYEYEVRKNEKKRTIYLLKKIYLQQFINDMRNIMSYDLSSSYINEGLIKTENTRNTLP